MHVELGWTYKFSFISDFSILDGIYTVVKVYSYEEFLNDGLSLASTLYSVIYKDPKDAEAALEEDLLTKEFNYREQEIYKLRDPEYYDTVIYVPESIILKVPNFNIKKYSNVVVAINLGLYPGDEDLSSVREIMSEHLSSQLGYMDTPDLITIGHKWLSEEDYNAEQANREANKKNVINYFSECTRLSNINSQLSSTIENYNKLFKDWINSDKSSIIQDKSLTQYIRVDNDTQRFVLNKDKVKLNDMVEVLSTRSVYTIIDTDNLNNESGYRLYDISDPTYISLLTEKDRLELTTADVQVGDRVKVDDTKTLYRVVDTTKLGTDDGFVIELVEKTLSKDPKFITVANDTQRFALTKKQVDELDYVYVVSSGCIYTVISTYYLSVAEGYELLGKLAYDSRLIRVAKDSDRFKLTIDKISLNDCVLVDESKTLYTVVDPNILNHEDGWKIEFVEKVTEEYPSFIEVDTDEQRYLLTRRKVSNNDKVFVKETTRLYVVSDETNLNNDSGYTLMYQLS